MAVGVLMPKQGQSVESCIITEWVKKKGDPVKKGDVLYSYETDKASFECEAEEEGILLDIFYEEGDEVPVLVNVAAIGNEGDDITSLKSGGSEPPEQEEVKEEKTPAASEMSAPVQENIIVTADGSAAGEEVKISPRAKKLAAKLGVAYQDMQGSGPYGRVIEQDIAAMASQGKRMTAPAAQEAAATGKTANVEGSGLAGTIRTEDLFKAPAAAPAGADYEIKKLSNIRKVIAKNMWQSMQSTAQLTHHIYADARSMQAIRKKVKPLAEKGQVPNITINDMVCFALVKTLKAFPEVNAHFLGDSMRLFNKVHLGIAVDTPRGLMVPTLKNADDFNLEGLATNLKTLALQCREGKIDPELLNSEVGSCTVSNLGAYGIEMFTPVLNIPQVAILGVCTIAPRPADIGGGTIAFVPHIGLSLTYDHRSLDGAPASAFLKQLKTEIETLTY